MKTNNMISADYESPLVEIISVEVEKGFASSGDRNGDVETDIDEMLFGDYYW